MVGGGSLAGNPSSEYVDRQLTIGNRQGRYRFVFPFHPFSFPCTIYKKGKENIENVSRCLRTSYATLFIFICEL